MRTIYNADKGNIRLIIVMRNEGYKVLNYAENNVAVKTKGLDNINIVFFYYLYQSNRLILEADKLRIVETVFYAMSHLYFNVY